jgi:serine/threonine protein kinase
VTHETLKTVFSVYKIGEVIGEGGGGKVRSAQNESGQFFAVKMLDTSKTFPAGKLKRFENECRLGKNYDHENIIKIVDQGVTKYGEPFFVMPKYVKGRVNSYQCGGVKVYHSG